MNTRRFNSTRAALAVMAILALTASLGHAAGFAIVEQSARGIGNAYAGATVASGDAGGIFFNPAGLTGIPHAQVSVGGHAILPSFEFTDGGSTPVGGGNGGDAGVDAYVPNVYAVLAVTERLRAGLGIHAPYGLKTEYEPTWIGRYSAIETDLKTLNINPTLAYRVTDNLSIGMGVSAQYASAVLSSAVPFPGVGDVEAEIRGNDWAYGFNLGVLCTLNSGTRLGVAYRSAIKHKLTGGITVGALSHEPGAADLDLPDTASFGVYQPIGNRVAVMGDITWTGWSRFDELRVVTTRGDLVAYTDESWNSTFRYALGANIHATDRLVLRTGIAFDESPVPDPEHRTARIPDSDRTWLSFGAGFQLTDTLAVDAGYTHLWIEDSEVNHTYDPRTGALLKGSYEGAVDIVSVQASWTL